MPGSNMYGTPRQTYAVLNNVFYPADGNGLIANVAQADVQALVAQGCMSEAQWLKVQAAHPAGGGLRFMPFFGDTTLLWQRPALNIGGRLTRSTRGSTRAAPSRAMGRTESRLS
jgi:hypothetical protein